MTTILQKRDHIDQNHLWFNSVKEDKSQDNHFSNSDSAGRELPKQNKECLPPRQAYSHSSSLGIFEDKSVAILSANEYSQKKRTIILPIYLDGFAKMIIVVEYMTV